MRYEVDISGRLAGAIGVHGTHGRKYTVEVPFLDDVNMAAIEKGHADGLEHIKVLRVKMLDVADGLHNPNCDGDKCATMIGEVRVYPIGGGGNLILCHSCWAHENRYRYQRGRETGEPNNWPQLNWYDAKGYDVVYGVEYKADRS